MTSAAPESSPARPLHTASEAPRLLRALGKDPATEHLSDTPRRVAESLTELITPREFDLTTFPNDEGYDELVLARDIPVQSLCEHHMLPFHGIAHIGYLPGDRILGLSKLARIVEHLCMSLRGVRATGSRTVTSALHGLLREDARSRQEFFALTGTIRH